ncbi:DUF2971 domain-containing protein [Fuerstiella marisgermanici]|uniref:DUF2971 domain-containing protein n=1 Tax=Fuerstiella marisgermanici TaxID=1891926 RepID=A0A1P8WQ21_9PLAN|nr:DUF2971 domain-containing protein [Fuerstiella marisgermanici]APZ96160.1 hypothetical protein Fuma_05828 [Fuerstiella marisgermanici]
MSAPAVIYRYQAPKKRNVENVERSLLWLSHPSKFNDPFDCAGAMFHNRPDDVKADCFYDALLNFDFDQTMEFAQDFVEEEGATSNSAALSSSDIYFRRQLSGAEGVTCFSELPKNLLMWSHYADSHKGFCLEYSTEYSPFRQLLCQVSYEIKMPTVAPSVREFGDLFELKKFLLIKAREWRYEKEWRIASSLSNAPLDYPPEALKRILIGAKATTRTVNALRRSVEGRPVSIVRLKLSDNRFRLEESPD